ncbi:hypothetical protein ACFLT4_04095 [Chloroflexota bacterium]
MSYAKWLQVIGLSSAFIGTMLLSIGVIGKDKTCNFIIRWIERFRRHRQPISLSIGIATAVTAILSPMINLWKVPVIDIIIPLMSEFSYISVLISTILTLVIIQFAIGGRASFRRIGANIVIIVLVCYRAIKNPSSWKSLIQRLLNYVVVGFRLLINPSAMIKKLLGVIMRVISMLLRAYFYVLVLVGAISYLATSHPIWWAMSTTINLTIIVTFSLIMLGLLLAWSFLRVIEYLAGENVEKTYRRLSIIGFILLGLGFLLQLFGIII